MSAAVVAIGALSPFGRGTTAFDVSEIDAPARVAITHDPELARLGFVRPFSARVPREVLSTGAPAAVRRDRASHLLFDAWSDSLAELGEARPGFRQERLGIAIGTSSGGMLSAEELFATRARGGEVSPDLARASTYFAPFECVLSELGFGEVGHRVQLVTACAASTWALGMALRWLDAGEVDVAFAGGYDAVGPFVAAGFEALRATSATLPSPFRLNRDGMALGEGAGVVALVRSSDLRGAKAHFHVTGFGASTDAVHITAPDRTGNGLYRAARAALEDARTEPSQIEAVSAHATATPYNDAMESRAIAQVFGNHAPVVHAFKAQIGHTLGAAGVLETLAIAHAMHERVLPASAGSGELDPDAPVTLLQKSARAPHRQAPAVLKESAAFGGANAALILEKHGREVPARSPRPVYVRATAHAREPDVELVARASGIPADRVTRVDELSLLGATSLARLLISESKSGSSGVDVRGAGIVVGHALATIDINERFYARVLSRGPKSAEPRVFPPTSPNLTPGQIAILFGLTGPSAATCGSPAGALEAIRVAHDLVAAGDTDRMVVVAIDLAGPTSRAVWEIGYPEASPIADGAFCVVLEAHPPVALRGSLQKVVSPPTLSRFDLGFGHAALAKWLGVASIG